MESLEKYRDTSAPNAIKHSPQNEDLQGSNTLSLMITFFTDIH